MACTTGFSLPEGVHAWNAVGILPGIDLRTEGGYVVAPPSVHPNGNAYSWADGLSPAEVEIAPTPAWLLELLAPKCSAPDAQPVPEQVATENTRYGLAALQAEADATASTAPGGRNARLNRAAFSLGQLVAGGELVDADVRAVLIEAARSCGLVDDDGERAVLATIRSGLTAGKREPRSAPKRPDGTLGEAEELLLADLTDSGNAEVLAHFHGDDLRFDHERSRWLVWCGHWWAGDADGEPPRMVREVAAWRAKHAYSLPDDAAEHAFKWAVQTRQAHRVKAALAMAESTRPIADTGEGWDARPELLAVANGVLDLGTCELRDGRRDDRLTLHVPWAYHPDATCARWLCFLSEVFGGDEKLIEHVRRAVGYSLTGEQSEQCWWLLHGGGRNGKSTFLETLRHVLGPLGWSTGFSTFAAGRAASGHSEDLANLEGKRLVTASETAEGTRLNEARIKALTGGDTINASAKYAHERAFEPQLSLWLGVNHLPTVTDDSYAFWRRVRFIPFLQTFRPKEDRQDGDLIDDKALKATLRGEAPGILSWAVAGCRAWREGGLTMPPTVVEAVEAYRLSSDPLGVFLEDHTVAHPQAFATTGDLFRAYDQWAESESIPQKARLTHTAFGRRIGERFENVRRRVAGQSVRGYVGIGLLTHEAAE